MKTLDQVPVDKYKQASSTCMKNLGISIKLTNSTKLFYGQSRVSCISLRSLIIFLIIFSSLYSYTPNNKIFRLFFSLII